jgi:hypothetical protein
MTATPTPNFVIGGDQDHTNNRPTASGGVSGPFRARRGFDAHGHKGTNFQDPDGPPNLGNPSGDGEVVNTNFFWDHANFLRWDGKAGFLPDPMTQKIVSGESYAVRLDAQGRQLGRIAVWDGQLTTGAAKPAIAPGSVFGVVEIARATDPVLWVTEADGFVLGMEGGAWADHSAGQHCVNATGAPQNVTAGRAAGLVVPDQGALLWLGDSRLGQGGWAAVSAPGLEFRHQGAAAVGTTPGNWRFLNFLNWIKELAADTDQQTDAKDGDVQFTVENQAKELKVWHNDDWINVYREVDVRAWIAALSLFEGTVQEVGGTTPNVLLMSGLPDLVLNTQIDKIAHYYTWQGSPGYVIKAADPNGVGRDLPGTVLNPGDWLQCSNKSGDIANPDLHWSHVGGDLLAASRGRQLFGLQPWTAGGWEIGSLVVSDQAIWRATGPVVGTDGAPGTAGAPWAKVTLAAGVRWVSVDGDLPANAPPGEIWFVVQSAQAGGAGGLFYWDNAANQWDQLGGRGGGTALDLTNGLVVYPSVLPAPTTPAGRIAGDLYLDTTKGQLSQYYDGAAWQKLAGGGGGQKWSGTGARPVPETDASILINTGAQAIVAYSDGAGGWVDVLAPGTLQRPQYKALVQEHLVISNNSLTSKASQQYTFTGLLPNNRYRIEVSFDAECNKYMATHSVNHMYNNFILRYAGPDTGQQLSFDGFVTTWGFTKKRIILDAVFTSTSTSVGFQVWIYTPQLQQNQTVTISNQNNGFLLLTHLGV